MTSDAQIEASRRNATKSTGPRTPDGKAAIAANALKHGLLSREVRTKGESEADLVDFGKRLRGHLQPVGELELFLADRVISTAWRLRRAVAVERGLYDCESEPHRAFNDYGREKMAVLSRYETTLERSLFRALHELQRVQATRAGEAFSIPEAVDIDLSISGPADSDQLALNGENQLSVNERGRNTLKTPEFTRKFEHASVKARAFSPNDLG